VTARRILIAGWLVFLLFAYPGYLTIESVDQLLDARVGSNTDWYAPVLSAIWRWVHHVVAGPVGMLVVQSGLFLAGLHALLRRALPARQAAVAAIAILCFPPVAAPLAVIWRDAQLAGFLLAGAAALTSDRRGFRIAGVALVILGTTMRDAAALAALPLVIACFPWPEGGRPWSRRLAAGGAWIMIAVVAHGLDSCAVDTETDRAELARARLDIIGVLRYAHDATDAELRAELERAGVVAVAATDLRREARRIYRNTGAHAELLPLPDQADANARATLLRARRTMALAHPGAYLTHRSRQLRILLGFEPSAGWRPVYAFFLEDPSHPALTSHRAKHSWVQRQLIRGAKRFPSVCFRPYVYALLALALLPLAIVRRDRIAGALLASGLLYELALAFTETVPEYRHSHWMIACTTIATVMLAAQELRRRRADRPPHAPST